MPNTLAHIGINGLLSRTLIRQSDFLLIYIGAIIPDIPWILQRTATFTFPNINLYDLRLYCIIQSTLFFSLILSAAVGLIYSKSQKSFLILSLGSLIHLAVDSVETKWANGVHLFAPFSWDLFNAGIFWSEHFVIHALTIFGFIYLILKWREAISTSLNFQTKHFRKLIFLIAMLTLYFLGPLIFLRSPESADNHFIKTLRNYETRAGKYFEVDRGNYIDEPKGDIFITPFREYLKVNNLNLPASAVMSIRAKFISKDEIYILEYHIYNDRDIFSYIGLLMILIVYFLKYFKNHGLKSSILKY